ncbi:hypothetical protein GA0115240_10816 [Streptomyces sp. DvalAA-14]|uniref:hypothetical protein n=1 Tax=unclassified Streptomyces TaxID=2593676 RepID=UPI00081B6C8D|nr:MULTISPECIES: hypothetical protein [unclassified Streptomyces]MYS19441.1 hypothetical protein [Streptomyces sp. SID4948]SCD44473.1 hypothetical protein GA0115240_10816 [Streptomyces sp. DvalAA-14]
MTQPIDAQELLSRILRARDFARAQEERFADPDGHGLAADGTARPQGAVDPVVGQAVYRAVRSVLDEIVEPGVHEREAGGNQAE